MRPQLHFTPKRNWINDPNGLIYFNGCYHIFYQHFPYSCKWGTMHWGHVTTNDFVHFEDEGIALYPSKDYDANGCFSGSSIILNNQLYMYYTSIKYAKINPNDIHVQFSDDDLIASQSLITSSDGIHFDNINDKQKIIDVIYDENIGSIQHTRDPKVWKTKKGTIAMVLGTKVPYGNRYVGKVLFYESNDGIYFELRNSFNDPDIGDMWECPGMVEIDHQWYLIFSPEHTLKSPYPSSNAYYMAVDFDEETFEVKSHDAPVLLDEGLDFYAPQTFISKNDEVYMFGWLRMRQAIKGEHWVGMFSYPRVLKSQNKKIISRVVKEVDDLFAQKVDEVSLNQPFKATFKMNEHSSLNIAGAKIYLKDALFFIDRTNVCIKHDQVCPINHNRIKRDRYEIELYYDHHVIECYLNGGQTVLSQVIEYPTNDLLFDVQDLKLYTLLEIE